MPQPRQHPDNATKQRAYRARQAHARLTEQHAKGLPPAAPIPTLPSRARWHALLAQGRCSLEIARDEMQAYCCARTEVWQASDRAATLQDQLDQLEAIIEDLDALPPL